jgi:NADH:ubiquinone oxidoreductase subunit 4 (subunit M)
MHLLTISWVLPLAGAILLLLVPNKDGSKNAMCRWLALLFSLATFAVTSRALVLVCARR